MHGSTSVRSQVSQRRPGGFAAGIAAHHAAALFPASLAFDLVGGRAVLGHAVYSDRIKSVSESSAAGRRLTGSFRSIVYVTAVVRIMAGIGKAAGPEEK